ncbi:hypothetical protein bas01_0002 [Escherichia phage AugustePiccard]|uniref:Uncharacterized protein n=1 Tax=Escherichia phage AugustePiccard TaxID=2851954 RepID=A0AAE7VNY3_9CAUD|nr:hypothetical protein bas01_0002 [Escherichia phage AugustePiccard]
MKGFIKLFIWYYLLTSISLCVFMLVVKLWLI